MRLSWWGHSCVRIELPGGQVVLDPGAWSDLDGALEGVGAILVTHEHADHLAVDRVVSALAPASDLQVWGPESVVTMLADAGAPAERLHTVRGGDVLHVGGVQVDGVGEQHAVIHPDIPRIANVGYLVGGVYHPGDSLQAPPHDVEVLLAPVGAPWLKLSEAVDLVRAVGPGIVVPIHDAVLSDAGRGLADRIVGGLCAPAVYRRLSVGESLDV